MINKFKLQAGAQVNIADVEPSNKSSFISTER